ncbi:hypothetical protein DIPPA_01508 [Diplonema papillatum]|nr:hypothetical protein DIPPA_01508 [Diplonema papillatum]
MQDVVTAAKKNPIYAGIELDVDKGATTKDAFHTGLGKYDEETLGGRGGLIWVGSGGMATAKKFYTPTAAKEWDEEVICSPFWCPSPTT